MTFRNELYTSPKGCSLVVHRESSIDGQEEDKFSCHITHTPGMGTTIGIQMNGSRIIDIRWQDIVSMAQDIKDGIEREVI